VSLSLTRERAIRGCAQQATQGAQECTGARPRSQSVLHVWNAGPADAQPRSVDGCPSVRFDAAPLRLERLEWRRQRGGCRLRCRHELRGRTRFEQRHRCGRRRLGQRHRLEQGHRRRPCRCGWVRRLPARALVERTVPRRPQRQAIPHPRRRELGCSSQSRADRPARVLGRPQGEGVRRALHLRDQPRRLLRWLGRALGCAARRSRRRGRSPLHHERVRRCLGRRPDVRASRRELRCAQRCVFRLGRSVRRRSGRPRDGRHDGAPVPRLRARRVRRLVPNGHQCGQHPGRLLRIRTVFGRCRPTAPRERFVRCRS
jgi:hypothetical protein